jgi:hypothetical protein
LVTVAFLFINCLKKNAKRNNFFYQNMGNKMIWSLFIENDQNN